MTAISVLIGIDSCTSAFNLYMTQDNFNLIYDDHGPIINFNFFRFLFLQRLVIVETRCPKALRCQRSLQDI